MHTITIPEAHKVITSVALTLREPLMIWGQPGVGKSALIAQIAEEKDAHLIDIRLSQYDSVDLRGIPSPDTKTRVTHWNMPSTLPFKGNPAFAEITKPIILFLDEVNSAAPAVSAVAYQLINDRRVGEHELMENVVVIAAGNREGDKGVTNRMPLPLANRFTHIEIGVDVDAFCDWLTNNNLGGVGVAFLQFRKNLVTTFDATKPEKSFATPRTWAKAFRYYNTPDMPETVKQTAMAGAVGDGPAHEFWGFVDIWHKVKNVIPDILKDPSGYEFTFDAGTTYAVTVALSGELKPSNSKAIHTFLLRLSPEFAVLAWKLAVQRDASLFATPEFLDFSKKFKAVFK